MLRMLDRRGTTLRLFATGTVLAGLASCGGSNPFGYTVDAPNSVVVADFNGDGHPDVAVASAQVDQLNPSESPGYVSLMLQNSASPGSFQNPVHFNTDGNPSAMAAGDLLGTGGVDLAVANVNRGTVSVLLQTAPRSGSFQPEESVATGGTPKDVAICDVNGDGHPDLVVADGSTSGGNLIIALQDASNPGHFVAASKVAQPPTYKGASVPNPAYGIACGNLNGDGHSMDVVMTSFATDPTSLQAVGASGTVSIFPHDPANPGHFLPRVDIPVAGIIHRVKIADLNHDGYPDIVVPNEGPGGDSVGTAGVVVLLQNASTPGTFAAPVNYSTYPAISLAVGDLNGDGLPDLVITSSGSFGYAATQVLYNVGSSPGTFGAPAACAGGNSTACSSLGNPVDAAIGDLNNDGLPDIATADGTGGVVLLQNPSQPGTFQAPVGIGT